MCLYSRKFKNKKYGCTFSMSYTKCDKNYKMTLDILDS